MTGVGSNLCSFWRLHLHCLIVHFRLQCKGADWSVGQCPLSLLWGTNRKEWKEDEGLSLFNLNSWQLDRQGSVFLKLFCQQLSGIKFRSLVRLINKSVTKKKKLCSYMTCLHIQLRFERWSCLHDVHPLIQEIYFQLNCLLFILNISEKDCDTGSILKKVKHETSGWTCWIF